MSKYLNGKFRNLVNEFLTPNPKDVEGLNNSSFMYYQDELFMMIQSVFDIENCPDIWDKTYILDNLIRVGYMPIVSTDLGALILYGGYSGINIYNKPTNVIVANPVLGTIERTIGVDGELLYLSYTNGHYVSLFPLVKRYAILLAQCDGSINTNLMNSRLAHVFMASNKANAETAKYIYDEITKGNPAVFLNKERISGELFDDVLFGNVKNVYIGTELQDTKRTIRNEFLTTIGINNVNTDKKERLISDEANANNGERMSLVSLWLRTMNEQLDKAKEIMDIDNNVRFVLNNDVIEKYQEELRGVEDEFNQYNESLER